MTTWQTFKDKRTFFKCRVQLQGPEKKHFINDLAYFNFQIVTRSAQFGIEEVEVTTATIDLEEIRSYRNVVRSRNLRGAASEAYPRIEVH